MCLKKRFMCKYLLAKFTVKASLYSMSIHMLLQGISSLETLTATIASKWSLCNKNNQVSYTLSLVNYCINMRNMYLDKLLCFK